VTASDQRFEPSGGTAQGDLAELLRSEGRKVIATLTRLTGDISLAEESLQDAIERALIVWPKQGVPRKPAAWLTVTARNKALDRIRRESGRGDRERESAWIRTTPTPSVDDLDELFPESVLRDDQLRLIFTVCHPALSREARVALALKTVGGLSTVEIARALLVPEPTVAQRIVRAKRKITDAHIPFTVPSDHDLPARLNTVLETIYAIFTAGHHPAEGGVSSRFDLAAEGLRVAGELASLMPDEPECVGLWALALATHARSRARTDHVGEAVLLADQDRSRWDHQAIAKADRMLSGVLRTRRPGPFQLQAAIACLHGLAPTFEQTDWAEITELYGLLFEMQPTVVVRVNWAVAAMHASGADAGLMLIRQVDESVVERWHLYWVTRAEIEHRAGMVEDGLRSLDRALACDMNDAERTLLSRRRAERSR
jgi:RNA polymerase sigma-70 factor, ECF subfamily